MQLDLASIAATLEGLEETIISKLIDRAQFRHNPLVYLPGKSGFTGEQTLSLFALRLRYQEEMDAEFGRFCVPEERPFNASLPTPQRTVVLPDRGLRIDDYNAVNLTGEILQSYLDLVPRICQTGSDEQFGSSVEHDVYAVQAIARRVHFGSLFVAESKYRENPREYQQLVAAGNRSAITEKLTRKEVEDRIIERVRTKVHALQSTANTRVRHRIDPEIVVTFYRETIIPCTKRGEVLYLLQRRTETT